MSYEVVIFGIKLTLSPIAFTIPLGSRAGGDSGRHTLREGVLCDI